MNAEITAAPMGNAPGEVELWTHDQLPDWLRQRHPRTIERLSKAGKLGAIRPIKLAVGVVYLADDVRNYAAAAVLGAPPAGGAE